MSLLLTFNKLDWQDFFQGSLISTAGIAIVMIVLTLFVALRSKRNSGSGAGRGDAGGNSE